MIGLEIWYHDKAEVDLSCSWTANSKKITSDKMLKDYSFCPYSKVLALVEYTRPDFILTYDGKPYLSCEITQENPSGHNIPQRFACLVRASELGVPSLFYYPAFARRGNSEDNNYRYANVRVPLAQLRMSDIFGVPSLSMAWPTAFNGLPTGVITDHLPLARYVDHVIELAEKGLLIDGSDKEVKKIRNEMIALATPKKKNRYRTNKSYRQPYPNGNLFSLNTVGMSVDPPPDCTIEKTDVLLKKYFAKAQRKIPKNKKLHPLVSREYCFVYKGTTNKKKTGPEHPYPGTATLFDILYLRQDGAQTARDRQMNLVFILPMALGTFREVAINRDTGLNILMEFCDLIILDDAMVLCGWMRNISSGAVVASWKSGAGNSE